MYGKRLNNYSTPLRVSLFSHPEFLNPLPNPKIIKVGAKNDDSRYYCKSNQTYTEFQARISRHS